MALSLEEYRRALEQADRQRMDTGYRLNTPGYNEYATAATKELFPGANSLLALSGIPLLSDAAGLAADIEMFQGNPETRGPVNYGLSGLGLLPFVPNVAASLRGVREGRKYYHGVDSAANGALSSQDSILRDGFTRGASSEEGILGTSISYDPTVSAKLFGDEDVDNVLGADMTIPASEVWNLPPDLYMAGYRAGDGQVVSKPNIPNQEAELFGTRPELPASEIQRFAPWAKAGPIDEYKNMPTEILRHESDYIKDELADYAEMPGAGSSGSKRAVSPEERELMDEMAAVNAIIEARESGQLRQPTAPFTPRELNSTENQYVQRQMDYIENTDESLTNLFSGDNPTRKDVRDTVEGLSNVRGNRAYFDRMMESTGDLINKALDPSGGSSQVAKALIEAVGPKNVDRIATAAADYKAKMTKASEMIKPRLQAENTSLDDLMLRTKGDIRNEGNPQARQAAREAAKARNELFDLLYHSTFSK